MFLVYLKGGRSDFFTLDLQLFPGSFSSASLFPWVSDAAVVMTGVGDAFLHIAIELDTHTKEHVWNEP